MKIIKTSSGKHSRGGSTAGSTMSGQLSPGDWEPQNSMKA